MAKYGKPDHIGDGAVTSVSNIEKDVVVIDNGANLTDSQLTIFLDVTIGTHTKMYIKYYVRWTPDGDWFELPYRNDGTGALASVPTFLAASEKFVDSLPLPACMEFKVVAVGDTANTDGAVTANVLSRDN